MKILITGFDPFGGEAVNPSFEAVKLLPDWIGGAEVIKLELPTVFFQAGSLLQTALEQHRPRIVICVGQAGGRDGITPERVAINVMDASKPDNAGFIPQDQPILPHGPAAYFSKLPIKQIVSDLTDRGIPAKVSNSAGTFVCNSVMYTLLDWIEGKSPETVGGFVHVPFLPRQAVGKEPVPPSMELSQIAEALNIIVETTIKTVE